MRPVTSEQMNINVNVTVYFLDISRPKNVRINPGIWPRCPVLPEAADQIRHQGQITGLKQTGDALIMCIYYSYIFTINLIIIQDIIESL